MIRSRKIVFLKWLTISSVSILLISSEAAPYQNPQNDILREKAIRHFSGIGAEYNEAKGKELLLNAAQSEDNLAKMWIARCKFHGIYGFKKDIQQAQNAASALIPELKKRISTNSPNPEIQFLLGDAYLYGIGVKRDIAEAKRLHFLAAEQDFPMAVYNIGEYYFTGKLGETNEHKSIEFIARSAKLGQVHAITAFVEMSIAAGEKSVNYADLFTMLYPAAEKGFPKAMLYVGMFYYEGTGVTENLTLAAKWLEKAGYAGIPNAALNAGIMFEEGIGVSVNKRKAFQLLKIAADAGIADAMQKIGSIYRDGIGVTKNCRQAAKYFTAATDSGHIEATKNLGYLYLIGCGVPKNYNYAKSLFELAAKHGNNEAMYNIGLMYMHGDGVYRSDKNALYWFEKAANAGHVSAMYNCGVFYYKSRGTSFDKNRALYWWKKAADKGHRDARHNYDVALEN